MATELRLARLTDEMQEGTVSRWLKKVGDAVKKGEPIVEVETEKVIVEVEAPEDGVLLEIVAQEQEVVAVEGVLCLIGAVGEKSAAARSSVPAKNVEPPAQPAAVAASVASSGGNVVALPRLAETPEAGVQASSRQDSGVAITPLARRVAGELGIDLAQVKASGIGGKIIMSDLQPFLAGAFPAQATGQEIAPIAPQTVSRPPVGSAGQSARSGAYEDVPLGSLRGTIARRMAESKANIPHFYMTTEADIGECLTLRKRLNARLPNAVLPQGRITINDMMLKAAAMALLQVPQVNASFLDGAVRQFKEVHIGFAVAIEGGLVTPVVRDCHQKSIGAIARETASLIERAKGRSLKAEDMQGGTFTISNLGMFDVSEFSAIINPPQVGILAIARPVERAMVRNGWIVAGKQLSATLSADHRALDGVTGAEFLTAFKLALEDPERLLL